MEFPSDIWTQIMSYFHSSWRRTYHIDAMTALLSNRPNAGWKRVQNIYDSFYLYLQCDLYLWQRSPEIQFLKIKSPFYFRKVANTGQIRQDISDIWKGYSKLFPDHHLIPFIRI